MKEILFGMGVGFMVGAILVYVSPDVRNMMKKGEKILMDAKETLKEKKEEIDNKKENK